MLKIRIRCGIALLLQILFFESFADWRAFGQGAEIDGKLPSYSTGLFILVNVDGGCGLAAIDPFGQDKQEIPDDDRKFPKIVPPFGISQKKSKFHNDVTPLVAEFDDRAEVAIGSSLIGVIGHSAMVPCSIHIDPQNRRFSVEKLNRTRALPVLPPFRIQLENDKSNITLTINRREIDAAIGFGCELDLILPRKVLNELTNLDHCITLKRVYLQSYDTVTEGEIALVPELNIAGIVMRRLQIGVVDSEHAILGFRFLSRFDCFVDLTDSEQWLTLNKVLPNANFIRHFFEDFEYQMVADGMQITDVAEFSCFQGVLFKGDLIRMVRDVDFAGKDAFTCKEHLASIFLTGGSVHIIRDAAEVDLTIPVDPRKYLERDRALFGELPGSKSQLRHF